MTFATETFARRIREERQRAGLSQAAVAARLSELVGRTIDHSAVARSEKHERPVRLDEAVALAEILEVPLTSLLRDRTAVDEQLGELQRDLALAEWQSSTARDDYERAQVTVSAIQRRIAELEDVDEG
ncbi:helix-turn-helix domain-containing protein [Microbacterium sp. NPDC055903]